MKSSEIRSKFLKYFEEKGHKVLPGSSLVPEDPTVLLTLAGMLQFKPIFLGQKKAQNKRVSTVQKCIRTIDIDQVGQTARHHTFFEMLGNFSFGDYFKSEAIKFAWQLLVEVYKLPKENLFIAVYEEDDETYKLWQDLIGLPQEKIYRLDAENNFWSAGETGPCGPCSEIYYDLGPARGCGQENCGPGCECDRFLEIWNLVFMQYDRDSAGKLHPLKNKNIDTGMGLERLAAVLQGAETNFETDLFIPLIDKVKEATKQKEPKQLSLKIIADHARAVTHLTSDGVMPGNTSRGYVLRRLIRRLVCHARLLEIEQPLVCQLAKIVIGQMKDVYPVLKEKEQTICQVLETEEKNFMATLEQGLAHFRQIIAQQKNKVIPGQKAFKLHDTYGFPIELTVELAQEKGFKVDQAGFEQAMVKQKERARLAGLGNQEKQAMSSLDLEGLKPTKFVGYDKTEGQAKVEAVFPDEKFVVLDQSPFYGESGGQVGDQGVLNVGKAQVPVIDTLITPNKIVLHKIDQLDVLKKGLKVEAQIDQEKRAATSIHHTATHLLHQALRDVLGDHVKQAGSYVGPDKLRFDFSHNKALTPEQVFQVEEIVNQKVKAALQVDVLEKSYDQALSMGAVALFGEKYGDKVRVLKIDDYSLELCGGTHVGSTDEIGFLKIISETSPGAGMRRIEAVAGAAARTYLIHQAQTWQNKISKLGQADLSLLEELAIAIDQQKTQAVVGILGDLEFKYSELKKKAAKEEKEKKQQSLNQASQAAVDYVAELQTIKDAKVLIKKLDQFDMKMMRTISDTVRNQTKSCIVVLASAFANRLLFLITVTDDLIAKGYSAKKIAQVFTPIVGAKGGGTDNKVEGGGKDPGKIEEAMAAVLDILNK